MLMNLRSLPCSSLICVESAGNVSSNSVSSAGKFGAEDSNSFLPSVCRVKAVGSNTLIDNGFSCGNQLRYSLGIERAEVSVKVGKPRPDGARVDVVIAPGQRI